MGNKAQLTSNRQKGLKLLDGLLDLPRAQAVEVLMDELNIKYPYANTLYQTHRRQNIANGTGLTTAYKVLDIKNGYHVDPFLSTRHVVKTKPGEFISKNKAIVAYVNRLQDYIKKANNL